jgi:hypothetical protein
MKSTIRQALLFFVATTLFWIVVLFSIPWEETEHYYNCDLAEISPDFPPKAREQCRELRREQWIKQHHNTST